MNKTIKVTFIFLISIVIHKNTLSMYVTHRSSRLRTIEELVTHQERLLSENHYSLHYRAGDHQADMDDYHTSNKTSLAQNQLKIMHKVKLQMALLALLSHEHTIQATAAADRQTEVLLKLVDSVHELNTTVQALKEQIVSKNEKRNVAVGDDAEEKLC